MPSANALYYTEVSGSREKEFIIRLAEQLRRKTVVLGHAASSSNIVKLQGLPKWVWGIHMVHAIEYSLHLLAPQTPRVKKSYSHIFRQ